MAQVKTCDLVETEQKAPEGETGGAQEGVSVPTLRRAVHRARILRDIKLRANEVSATIVIAPDGFGKTTLLCQRVAEVQRDSSRGVARMIDAAGMDGEELYGLLGELEMHLDARMRPLVAIDNLPTLHGAALEGIAGRMRSLHRRGFEFLLACLPGNRAFANGMGDAYKITPQALVVRPREYSDWTRMLGISGELDVYDLTQGIPALVAMLGIVDGRQLSLEAFSRAAAALYQGALEEMRRGRDSLYRTACLLVLTGAGSLRDFERIGMRVRVQSWSRIAREYPLFGVDVEQGTYRCLVQGSKAMGELCRQMTRARPLFAVRAIKILMAADNVDRAVHIAGMLEHTEDALGVLTEHPTSFALSGNVAFVRDMMESMGDVSAASTPVGGVLALYLSALMSGEFRLARALGSELRRRRNEIKGEVAPESWAQARALCNMWPDCRGIGLPEIDAAFTQGHATVASQDLELHARIYAELIGGSGDVTLESHIQGFTELSGEGVSIPRVLLACDRALVDAMCGDMGDVRAMDANMQRMATRLLERKVAPIATHIRMVAATCRLFSGLPVADERAFIDAGTLSVRTSDLATQLFCLVGEGWQALVLGQCSNALFRAHQVLKLATEDQRVVMAWARMLECCAHLADTPRMALDGEADLLDLAEPAQTPAEAWTAALRLAAAHRSSELSAWCSLNKKMLLTKGFTAFARQAVAVLGDKVGLITRVLPGDYAMAAGMDSEPAPREGEAPWEGSDDADLLLGQVNVRLFGGFQVERGGHVATDAIWRRRRACIIAARLVLAAGAFVGRKEIGEEVWPDKDYLHARETLYAGLSSLRSAFGQSDDGPQYVLTQGEGVAINTEYVVSDTMRFDALARDILLGRARTTGRQLIEACLRLDELYTGPLYVPNFGDTSFYVRQRRLYQTKFVDCMMRGAHVALELDDLPVASWLIDAALRQAPLREDVIRAAMHIYDKGGRRREVVELYNSHVHVLEQELHSLPERETQMAYEAIIHGDREVELLA